MRSCGVRDFCANGSVEWAGSIRKWLDTRVQRNNGRRRRIRDGNRISEHAPISMVFVQMATVLATRSPSVTIIR